MLRRTVILFLMSAMTSACFAGYAHCPFTEEEARQEGWIFRDGRSIGEHQLMSATIRKTDRDDVFRISCYYRTGYEPIKKIFAPQIVVVPTSGNWTVTEGSLLTCSESANACIWQIIT